MWFSTGWMKRNMCASCRILHDPIVFGNLLWWGNMPSLSIGSASMRVYKCEATDGWIFLRSYLDFSYVCTGSDDSIYDTSIIEVVDIPCRNSPYYVGYTHTWIFEPSVYIEWLWDQVTSLCRHLLLQQAFSESGQLAGMSIPLIPLPMTHSPLWLKLSGWWHVEKNLFVR